MLGDEKQDRVATKEEGMESGILQQKNVDTQSSAVGSKMKAPRCASTGEEGTEKSKCEFQPYDFFSGEEEGAAAAQDHEQAQQRSTPLIQDTKSSVCSRIGLPSDAAEDGNHILSSMSNSKVLSSGLPAPEHDLARGLDLSLKLPRSFAPPAEEAPGDNKHEVSLENLANSCWKSPLKVLPRVNSRDLSRLVSRPCSIILSAGSGELTAEMNNCTMPKSFSAGGLRNCDQSRSQERDDGGHRDGSGIGIGENWKEREMGVSWSYPLQKLSSSPSNINASVHLLAAFPGALSLTVPQEFVMKVDSKGRDILARLAEREEESMSDVALQVTPPAASCMESSECDNFGTDMIRGNIANGPNLIAETDGRSSYRSEEVDAMSEAGELEDCDDEDEAAMTQKVDATKAHDIANSPGHGALDLLVSAIQATSGPLFGEEEEELTGQMEKAECGQLDLMACSKEASFIAGRSPIVKKKVLRRARSAFKNHHGKLNTEIFRYENYKVVAHRSGRKGHASEDARIVGKRHETEGDERMDIKYDVPAEIELVIEGAPVIRSKRGRSQALPTKFSDSVLQPWKRKSRRKHKLKVEI